MHRNYKLPLLLFLAFHRLPINVNLLLYTLIVLFHDIASVDPIFGTTCQTPRE